MKNIAIYAGTFDPVTFGHVDIVERAATIFDKIVIGIAKSPKKLPLLTLTERIDLCKSVFMNLPKVEVRGFEGLLLDFVKQQEANIILRGLRTVTDFDYEFQLASMNRRMSPKVESLFLLPDEKFMSISSSLVREIALLGGDVSEFVPEPVVGALKGKYKSHGTENN